MSGVPDERPDIVTSRLVIPPFEVWIAVAAIYAGLSHFLPDLLHPAGNTRAVAAAFPRLAPIWSILYTIGGAAMTAGLARRSPRLEVLGVNLLGSGLLVATLAALSAGAPILPTLVINGGAVVACVYRRNALRRLR